jgi:NCS2 family nucleobase:cation symporter-2
LLASVSAVVLNVIFNGVKSEKKAQCEIRNAGHDFDGRGGNEPTGGDEMLRAVDLH